MRAKRHALLLLPIVGGSALACASPDLPAAPPAIVGSIVSFATLSPSATRVFEVRASPTDQCGIAFTGGQLSDLQLGAAVRVWTEGAVAESCPAQAAAATIEVME